MKKTFSKAELKSKAEKAFKDYPNEKKAFATVDGNIFFAENHAGIHAGPKGTIYTFEREVPVEDTEESKEKSRTAKEVIEMIEGAVTKEELEAYGFDSDDRKTVKEAYAKKLEDFNQENE